MRWRIAVAWLMTVVALSDLLVGNWGWAALDAIIAGLIWWRLSREWDALPIEGESDG